MFGNSVLMRLIRDTYLVSAVPTVVIGSKKRQIDMVPAEAYWQDLAAFGVE